MPLPYPLILQVSLSESKWTRAHQKEKAKLLFVIWMEEFSIVVLFLQGNENF